MSRAIDLNQPDGAQVVQTMNKKLRTIIADSKKLIDFSSVKRIAIHQSYYASIVHCLEEAGLDCSGGLVINKTKIEPLRKEELS